MEGLVIWMNGEADGRWMDGKTVSAVAVGIRFCIFVTGKYIST